jgi:hypothetical protein
MIWYKQLQPFFSVENVLDFIPSRSLTYTDNINILVRLSIYVTICVYLISNNNKSFLIVTSVVAITTCLHQIESKTEDYRETLSNKVDNPINNGSLKKKKTKCHKPNQENPFMNVMMNEYTDDPERNTACDVADVHEDIDKYFGKDLYRSVDDIYNKNSSTRQYYTTPNTSIPNDQEGFAHWLYGNSDITCKEGNGEKCKYFS